MSETQKTVIQHLVDDFGAQPDVFAGESWMILPPEKLIPALTWLHSQGFAYLAMVTAVDYWPQETPRFHMVYRLVAFATQTTINLRVPVPGISPSVPTLEKLYRNANWQEREVYDMFGIQFEGHSDLRRILMPADWQGHPQRKDYPLGYEEPQYSFNFDEIAGRKPHAREVE